MHGFEGVKTAEGCKIIYHNHKGEKSLAFRLEGVMNTKASAEFIAENLNLLLFKDGVLH